MHSILVANYSIGCFTVFFTISVFGSSCNSIFFYYPLLGIPSCLGDVIRLKEKAKKPECVLKRYNLHKLPCTEIVKSGTITVECRLVSEVCSMNFPCHPFTYSTVPRLRCCLCRLKTRREDVPKVNISDSWKMLVKIFICCSIITVKKSRSCHGSLHHVQYSTGECWLIFIL